MNVDSTKHFSHSEFTIRPEAASSIPFAGISVRTKEHVPNRKIGIVEGVNTFLVVYAVALRSLKDVSEPAGSFYIPVIDEFGQAAEHDGACSRLRFSAYTKVQNTAHDQAIEQNFQRMLVETGDDFQALRTMVNLMNPPPKEWRSVAPAVPPVKDKGSCEISEQGFTESAQPRQRKKTMPHQPAVPCDTGKPHRKNLKSIKERCAKPPSPHGGPISAWARVFVQNHRDSNGGDDQQNKHPCASLQPDPCGTNFALSCVMTAHRVTAGSADGLSTG